MPTVKYRHLLIAAVLLVTGIISPQAAIASELEVIIGFHEYPGPSQQELIHTLGGQISREYRLIPAVVATVPAAGLATLRDHPLVAYIEENSEVTSIDPPYLPMLFGASVLPAAATGDEYEHSWGVQHIGSKAAHSQGITGKEIKIAVIDSGIDYNNEELDDNYRGGYDFVNDDDNPLDDSFNSHGTNVAGIIAAEKNGTGVVGVAPEASLYALKVLTSFGSGLTSDTVAAIQWAVDNKMDIINISIQGEDKESLRAACDAAYNAGILIVAAAGNTNGQSTSYPASYNSVIAVTGTDKEDNLADFSPIGPEVELSAPGVSIFSTARTPYPYNGYGTLSGTSQAAPHVAGMAALIWSSGKLEDLNSDGEVNNKDVRLKLQTSINDLGDSGKDELFGYGLVNVEKAIPPAIQIYLERTQQWLAGWQTYTMESGNHHVSIQNNSLYGIISWVSENGRFRRDLSTVHIFKGYRQQPPQQIDFSLDATNTSLRVIFIPFGKIGSSADITITN